MDIPHALATVASFLLVCVPAIAVPMLSFAMQRSYKELRQRVKRGKSMEKTASKARSQLVFCGIFALWTVAPLVVSIGAICTGNSDVTSLVTAVVAGVTVLIAGVSLCVYAQRFDLVTRSLA